MLPKALRFYLSLVFSLHKARKVQGSSKKKGGWDIFANCRENNDKRGGRYEDHSSTLLETIGDLKIKKGGRKGKKREGQKDREERDTIII